MSRPDLFEVRRVAILGAGAMGGAIARAIANSGLAEVVVTNRSELKSASFEGVARIESFSLASAPEANRVAVRGAQVVMLGVKPAMVAEVLREVAADIEPGAVVVSLAAGVTIASMQDALGRAFPVVRAMPNTPALVAKGVTGLAASPEVSAAQIALVSALFESCGTVVRVPEGQIDALSTISGSGPAYVYFLIEAFTAAARAQGFDDVTARVLAEGTFSGSLALMDVSGEDPALLRKQVTSPNGTTERAIAVMADSGLDQMFIAATNAALARARELAAGA